MPDKTYKLVELVGVSETSVDEAVRKAVERAARSLKGLDWFEVTEIRGTIGNGRVNQFQVKLKVGFRILDDADVRGA